MLSLQTLLISSEKLGGVIAYSGGLKSENLEECKDKIIKGRHINFETPVLLVHGKLDEVVPFSSLDFTKNLFENIGFSITSLECSMLGHGIDQQGIQEGMEFLKKI